MLYALIAVFSIIEIIIIMKILRRDLSITVFIFKSRTFYIEDYLGYRLGSLVLFLVGLAPIVFFSYVLYINLTT